MKSQMTKLIKPMLGIGVAALMLLGAVQATQADNDDHGDSNSNDLFGSKNLLTVFEDIYWRWAYGNVNLPTDQNGNAVVAGTALMPLPDAPGDGTPGSINVTLKARQPFFLPLITWLGTSYTDGTPSDTFLDIRIFTKKMKLKLKLKVDGRTVLDERTALDYYTQFYFDPFIPFNQSGIDSIVYSQGIGILHTPLSPGRHVLKLDVQLPVSPTFAVEYHNTFNVTVQRN